jgi:hypothetical protein
MPIDRLPVGVIHRALHRLLVGTEQVPAVAPTVRVVVLAAGHTALPYGTRISPWGRLLDVWANRYNVLFIVSGGNYGGLIELDEAVPASVVDDPIELQKVVREHILAHAHERRILSPADSMNALTVGALHRDTANVELSPLSLDVLGDTGMPSPMSALGGGFNRQMKPEVFADGGRVLYRWRFDIADRVVLEEILATGPRPGVLVASPGLEGQTNAQQWMQGTSAAAGVVGHEAGVVVDLLGSGATQAVADTYLGLAAKALIVNAASWSHADSTIADALHLTDSVERRKAASRLLGYGAVDHSRVAVCTQQRITLIATGRVLADQAQEIVLPIPQSLSGRAEWRRVSATLAWFSPVNARHKNYRQARLWFDAPNFGRLKLARAEGYHHAVKRGSTQHELFEGTDAARYAEGTELRFRVNCAAGAGGLSRAVPYAMVVTFEVAETSEIRVYDEIAIALRAPIQIQAPRAGVV